MREALVHDSQHDVMPWLDYSWGVMTRACREFEDRVGSLPTGSGAKTRMIRKVLEDLRAEHVIELRGRGRAARSHKTCI